MRWSEIFEAWKPLFDKDTVLAPKPSIPGLGMFAGAYFPAKKIGWLEVVSAENRGLGVGREAVESFETWVRDQGGQEIRAEALLASVDF